MVIRSDIKASDSSRAQSPSTPDLLIIIAINPSKVIYCDRWDADFEITQIDNFLEE
jgi:hypothetical protein